MSVTDTITARQLVPTGTWKADPAHSTFEFAVRHMGITSVKGRFTDVEATLLGGDSPSLEGTIGIASVDTRDEGRDGHLQSPDFLDAERFPVSRFESISRARPRRRAAHPQGRDPRDRAGGRADGRRHRSVRQRAHRARPRRRDRPHDFGVSWNAPLPGGGLLVAARVKLAGSFSFVRKA